MYSPLLQAMAYRQERSLPIIRAMAYRQERRESADADRVTPSAPSAPRSLIGVLGKRKAKVNRFPEFMYWQMREFELKEGCLCWVKREIVPGGLLPVLTFGSSIDFSKTECEVVQFPRSKSKFILRPKEGHVWSNCDEHRYRGTAREFVLDADGCSVARESWILHLRQHIACARTKSATAEQRQAAALAALKILDPQDIMQEITRSSHLWDRSRESQFTGPRGKT